MIKNFTLQICSESNDTSLSKSWEKRKLLQPENPKLIQTSPGHSENVEDE